MKYILALLLFICTKPSISQTLAIAIDNLNILHIGIKNTISIATSEGLDKDVIAEIEGAEGEIKKIGNGFYINVEWQDGSNDTPLVKATHESQFAPTANSPFNVSFKKELSDHNRIPNTYKNVTFGQRYIRNTEGLQSSNRYVCAMSELLENRLK